MTKTLLKSRIFPNKNKTKIKTEVDNTKLTLPQNLQSLEQKFFYQEMALLNTIKNF